MAKPFQEHEQYPLNVVGLKGQHAFHGTEKVYFRGTTGLVGTAYGVPGVTVTRSSTGIYDLNYPPVHELDIFTQLVVPSGQSAKLDVTAVHPTSGTAKLLITRGFPSGISGAPLLYNPPTGTYASLRLEGYPITKF